MQQRRIRLHLRRMISLEINTFTITHNDMLLIRQIMAALLGVLLQVSLLGFSTASADPICSPSQSCCSGKATCHCLESGENDKPVTPALPPTTSQDQIAPLFIPADTQVTGILKNSRLASNTHAFPLLENFHGYSGVALRVSFCRYTI